MKTKIEIIAVGNEETKTYDIIKAWNDGTKTVYRTGELTTQEFEDMEYNTSKDWQIFLNTDQSHYIIKDISFKVRKATLANNGERVILIDNTRDLGYVGQIEVIYQDGTKGWEHEDDLIDREED